MRNKEIKKHVKTFNKSFEEIKSEYSKDFNKFYHDGKVEAGDVEKKIRLLEDPAKEKDIEQVIEKLKRDKPFDDGDTKILSTFTSKINKTLGVTNRLSVFKEGTVLNNGEKLKLFELFNTIKTTNRYDDLTNPFDRYRKGYLRHLFSVLKHCQKPDEHPIAFKLHKSIIHEVLRKGNDYHDYNTMCELYRTIPKPERHLNFAAYLTTIGFAIAKDKRTAELVKYKGSQEYIYLTNNVINVPWVYEYLDSQLELITIES